MLVLSINNNVNQCRCGHCKSLAPEWKVAGETFQPAE